MDDVIHDGWGAQSTPDSGAKDTSAPTPEAVVPESSGAQEGVQSDGLNYTENEDGTRQYEGQEQVETTDDPTPTPEEPSAS